MNTELGPCESLRAGEIRFTLSPRRPWWTPDRLTPWLATNTACLAPSDAASEFSTRCCDS